METHVEKESARRQSGFLVEKVFSQLFVVMLIGMLATILCNVIDAIVTGQFLGSNAVAAVGLTSPAVSAVSVVTALFVTGTSQLCTRNMGKADLEKVNQVFSTMAVCTVALCLLSGVALFLLAPAYIASVSSEINEEAARMAVDYLRGYAFLIPPMGLAVLLNGLMALDNDQQRSGGFAFVMLVSDVVFDLLNVLVFHKGMLGMALASAISCGLGLVYLLFHFRKKGHLLRFSFKNLYFGDVGEVLIFGFASVIPSLMNTVRSLSINYSLTRAGGTEAVAAFAAAGGGFILITSLIMTIQSVTSTLSSLSYGEEDADNLERILKTSLVTTYRIYLLVGTIVFLFAPVVAGIFLNDHTTGVNRLVATFVRFMTFQNLLTLASYSLTGAYTGTGQIKMNYLISGLRDGLFPCLCVLSLGSLFGLKGICFSLPLTGLLTLLCCLLIPAIANGKIPVRIRELLILPSSFALSASECYEATIRTLDEAAEVSRETYEFCIKRGENKKTAGFVSLFVEEMAGNTVRHGFQSVRDGRVELKLILKEDKRLIRMKDNGIPFDPIKWLEQNHSEDPTQNIGIKMIVGLAGVVQYVPAMSINTLLVYL